MKPKIILMLFLTLLVILFNGKVFALTYVDCRDSNYTAFCEYQGILFKHIEADEEFKMLLEPTRHPNFQEVFGDVLDIFSCTKKHTECIEVLKNPSCSVSKYIRGLLKFYEANKTKLIKNINNEDLIVAEMFDYHYKTDKSLSIVKIFEHFKAIMDNEQLNEEVDFSKEEL